MKFRIVLMASLTMLKLLPLVIASDSAKPPNRESEPADPTKTETRGIPPALIYPRLPTFEQSSSNVEQQPSNDNPLIQSDHVAHLWKNAQAVAHDHEEKYNMLLDFVTQMQKQFEFTKNAQIPLCQTLKQLHEQVTINRRTLDDIKDSLSRMDTSLAIRVASCEQWLNLTENE